MFDEYDDLFEVNEVDVLIETKNVKEEVGDLKDQRLVEVVNELLFQLEFGKEAELCIGQYFKNSKLTDRQRKVLEGTYILYYGTMALGVDNGKIMATSIK